MTCFKIVLTTGEYTELRYHTSVAWDALAAWAKYRMIATITVTYLAH